MRRLVFLALGAALLGSPALAQPVHAPDGDDTGATGTFAGVAQPTFYDVEARLRALMAKAAAMGPKGKAAVASLRRVQAFVDQQKARHDGELRDWDRETLNAQMNKIVAANSALQG